MSLPSMNAIHPLLSLPPKTRIFVRLDLNINESWKSLTNSYKWHLAEKTIRELHNQGFLLKIATHIGRPKVNHSITTPGTFDTIAASELKHRMKVYDEKDNIEYETTKSLQAPLENILQERIAFISKADFSKSLDSSDMHQLLENVRAWPEELSITQQSAHHFAKNLARGCALYIHDAFGTIAHACASLQIAPLYTPPKIAYCGTTMYTEIANLMPWKNRIKAPYILIIGGSKYKEKLDLLHTQAIHPLCIYTTAPANTPTTCKELQLQFPQSRIIPLLIDDEDAQETVSAAYRIIGHQLPIIITGAGPKMDAPESVQNRWKNLLCILLQSNITILVAGGDSSTYFYQLGITSPLLTLSTGGSATLAYLLDSFLAHPLPNCLC